MSKMLKAICNWIAAILNGIANYFLEAASFFEVKKEVVVHTAQLTARPAPKEEVVPIANSGKSKLKKPRKPRERSPKEGLKHGEFYAWSLLEKKNGKPFSGREISAEVGLDRSTFKDAQGKNPKKTEEYFVLFLRKNPGHPLLKEKEVQKKYFDLTGKELVEPTPSFQMEKLDNMEFPKVPKKPKVSKKPKGSKKPKVPKKPKVSQEPEGSQEPKDLNLGLISILCKTGPKGGYRRPSFTQEQAASLLGKGRCVISNAKGATGGEERLMAAESSARKWAEDYEINVEKTWDRMEKISMSVTDMESLKKACFKEKMKIEIFIVFWIEDIVYQGEAFRDMFPASLCKKVKTAVHKDLNIS